jgi:hypothetical protein
MLVEESQQGDQVQGRILAAVLKLLPHGLVRREITCLGAAPVRLEVASERLPRGLEMLRGDMDHQRQPAHQLHQLQRHGPVVGTPRPLPLHLQQQQVLRLLRREQPQLHHLRIVKPRIPCHRPLRRRVDQARVPRIRDKLVQPGDIELHAVKDHQPLALGVQPPPHDGDDLLRIPQFVHVAAVQPNPTPATPERLVARDAPEPVLQLVPRLGPHPVHAARVVVLMLEDVLTRDVGLAAPRQALDQHGRRALGPPLAVHEHLVQRLQLVLAPDEVRVGPEGFRVDEERFCRCRRPRRGGGSCGMLCGFWKRRQQLWRMSWQRSRVRV